MSNAKSIQELVEQTLRERGEDYADRAQLSGGKGDVVTAYVIGAMDQRRIHQMDVERFIGLLYAELNERRDWSASKAFEIAIEFAKVELETLPKFKITKETADQFENALRSKLSELLHQKIQDDQIPR